MAVPAVVRVKRSREDLPLEALLVECKKRKYDESKEEVPLKTVLTFAGTVKTQDENVHYQLSKALHKTDRPKVSFKCHTPDITKKLRDQKKSKWHEDRFKIVNCYRARGSADKAAEFDELTVVDIESHHTEVASTSSDAAEDVDYEYDLYYAECVENMVPGMIDSLVSVQPYELVNEGQERDEEVAEESEDSNDENNWRNDYPEEESGDDEERQERRKADSDDDSELMNRMARCGIGSGEELSDDEDDEALVYGRESPYTRYKQRCMRDILELSDSDDYFSDLDDAKADSD